NAPEKASRKNRSTLAIAGTSPGRSGGDGKHIGFLVLHIGGSDKSLRRYGLDRSQRRARNHRDHSRQLFRADLWYRRDLDRNRACDVRKTLKPLKSFRNPQLLLECHIAKQTLVVPCTFERVDGRRINSAVRLTRG